MVVKPCYKHNNCFKYFCDGYFQHSNQKIYFCFFCGNFRGKKLKICKCLYKKKKQKMHRKGVQRKKFFSLANLKSRPKKTAGVHGDRI
jgi:hypothetical protein